MGVVAAAILTVFVAPIIGGIAGLVLLPIETLLTRHRGGYLPRAVWFFGAMMGGVAMTWVSTLVFGWLSGPTPLWAVVLLSLAAALNGARRVRAALVTFGNTMVGFEAATPQAQYEAASETLERQIAKEGVDMEISWLAGDLVGIWLGARLLGLI